MILASFNADGDMKHLAEFIYNVFLGLMFLVVAPVVLIIVCSIILFSARLINRCWRGTAEKK